MHANIRKQWMAITIIALLEVIAPGIAFASDGGESLLTRFLLPDGVQLPSNWRVDPSAQTFLVIHGFRDKGTSAPCLRQAEAIQQRYAGANVIIVDWKMQPSTRSQNNSKGISFLGDIVAIATEYGRAVKTAKRVGKEVAVWMKEKRISPSRTVISGHSLGSHIAAFISNECTKPEYFTKPISVIIAADPAGPLFENEPPDKRLDKTDAQEIIVVHTSEFFGDKHIVGTVDIYVSWPDCNLPDQITQHSQARELITNSFLKPGLMNTDNTPFGANAMGFAFIDDGRPRYYEQHRQ